MTKLRIAFASALIALATGCASGHLRGSNFAGFSYLDAKVESVAAAPARPLKYVLLPADEKTDPGDIYQQRVAQFVERTLHLLHHQRVADPSQANATVYYSYGVGPHHVTTTYYNGVSFGQDKITHFRQVALKAVGQDKKTLWQCSAMSLGWSSDYSKVIPGLLGGLVSFIGEEIDGEQDVRIKMDDRDVEYILGLVNEDGSPVAAKK